MAFTERYVDSASAGGDGTTSALSGANAAWATFASAIAGVGVGPAATPTRINIKAGTYANTTTVLVVNTAGLLANPVWCGYKATPGDQDGNNLAVAGTDIPLITFTTGYLNPGGTDQIFSNLAVTSAATANAAITTATTRGLFYGIRATSTGASAFSRALSSNGANQVFLRCNFSCTSAAQVVFAGAGNTFMGCLLSGGSQGIQIGGATSINVVNCIFDSIGGDCISITTGGVNVLGCSFYAPAGNGIAIGGTPANPCFVANSHFENVTQATKAAVNNTTGTASNYCKLINNSYFNCTANVAGQGDIPLVFDLGTLAASGFNNAAGDDFTPSAPLLARGFPGGFENSGLTGYLDLGALQAQAAVGGTVNVFGGEF